MYRVPAESVAQALGPFNCASPAAPPSPAYPADQLPATVWNTPPGGRFSIRELPVSAIYRFPPRSVHTACGPFSGPGWAPGVPVPATPSNWWAAVTCTIRLLDASAITTLPAASIVTPAGPSSLAVAAAPPNGVVSPGTPVPASVVIVQIGRASCRER